MKSSVMFATLAYFHPLTREIIPLFDGMCKYSVYFRKSVIKIYYPATSIPFLCTIPNPSPNPSLPRLQGRGFSFHVSGFTCSQ